MAKFNDFDVNKLDTSVGKFMKLEAGDTVLRVMPPWAEGEMYFHQFQVHFGLNMLQEHGLVHEWFAETCSMDEKGYCPLCELAVKAKAVGAKTSNDKLLDLSSRIRAKRQYLINTVDLANPEEVKVLQFGAKVSDGLRALFTRKGNITNPETGFNVVVSKNKVPGQQWFDYSVSLDEKCDSSAEWEGWSTQLHDLSDVPKTSDPAIVAQKLEGVEFEDIAAPAGYTEAAPSSVSDDDIEEALAKVSEL